MEANQTTLDYRVEHSKFIIGSNRAGSGNLLDWSTGLAFDHHRGHLFVADRNNHRVQVFSTDQDGSLVGSFGSPGDQPGQLTNPWGIAIDYEYERIFITDQGNNRVQVWSLRDHSFLSCIGACGTGDLEFRYPEAITIDRHRRRAIIADTFNNRLQVLSLSDLSFLFAIGKQGHQPGEFYHPSGVAIDHERDRLIVVDINHNRIQVLSANDGSFLFSVGSEGSRLGQLMNPQGTCIDNQGRIIVADNINGRLQAFTPEGHAISALGYLPAMPWCVAFDEHRGLIGFSAGNQVHVIRANQWLADTYTWRPDLHRYAPESFKQAVFTLALIRSLVHESPLSMLPNELLFEILTMIGCEATGSRQSAAARSKSKGQCLLS